MAQLKDLLVSGPSRLIGKLFANEVQLTTLDIPTANGGTTYGPGTDGYYLRTNGTSVYWDAMDAGDIPGIDASKITTGTLPVSRGGTGVASISSGQVMIGNGTSAITTRAILNNTAAGALGWNSAGNTNADNLRLVDVNTIAYWNGAYSGTSSNLKVLGTVTTGTWNASTIGVGYGGTGKTSWTKYGILYADATNSLTNTAVGTAGHLLMSNGGTSAPSWKDPGTLDVNTAKTLKTARNISVGAKTNSFDGSADISFPTADMGIIWSDINPIKSKTYENVTVTGNSDPAGWLYFFKAPGSGAYQDIWHLTYRVIAKCAGQADSRQVSIVHIDGVRNTYTSYWVWNSVGNTSYRPIYGHAAYFCSTSGPNAYAPILGLRFQSALDPTNATYARTITFEILEEENCSVTFFNAGTLYSAVEGTGSTYFNTSRVAFDGTTQGITTSGDRNSTTISTLYKQYGGYVAGNNIKRYQLVFQQLPPNDKQLITFFETDNASDTTNKTLLTTEFDPLGHIYYYNSTGTNNTNTNIDPGRLYYACLSDLRFSFNVTNTSNNDLSATFTGIAYRPVYLRVVINATTGGASVDGNQPLTMTLPTTNDGKYYIYLGQVYDWYRFMLDNPDSHPVFYHDGKQIVRYYGKNIGGSAARVTDSNDRSKDINITYSKTAQTSTSWLASWNGYELGTISPGNITAGKATKANLTTTANAVAYFTDTAGTFGSKASANGALYATSANGTLQWGTLPVAQGGTGQTTSAGIFNVVRDNGGDGRWVKKAGDTLTGNINRYYSSASTDAMFSLVSNNLDATFFFIGHGAAAGNPSGNWYKLIYKGTGNTPNNLLQLQTHGSADKIAFEVNEDGKVTFPSSDGFTYSGIGAGSDNAERVVWFAYNGANGRPVYDNDFKYNPATNQLHLVHASGKSGEYRVTYSTTVDMWLGVGSGDENHGLYDAIKGAWMIYADASGNVTVNGNATTATTAAKATAANLTTNTNGIAYYTNTTGTFGNIRAASGAFYSTGQDVKAQFGTLPTAQGGTGNTSYTASRLLYTNTATKFASAGSLYTTGANLAVNGTSISALKLMEASSSTVDNGDGTTTTTWTIGQNSYTPVFQVTGKSYISDVLMIAPNKRQIEFRPNYNNYSSYISYQTTGNEALNFVNTNSVTSFIFWTGRTQPETYNPSDVSWNTTTDVPAVQIKQKSLYINKKIASGTNAAYNLYVNGTSYLNGNTTITGNILFQNTNQIIWNDGTYRQRIHLTDDSTANTAVFTFQQSSDSASTWKDLLIIKDNGNNIVTGGLEVRGHIAGDSGTTGYGLYSGGGYHNAYNNIILHGDASTGSSGIAFVSDKVTNGVTIANINQPSDRAFIQYHACGITTATAEGTAPTVATSGEVGRLVIGIGNDATDQIWLQTPGRTGLIHQVGATSYAIPDTGNTTGNVGSSSQPVYVSGGVITALTGTIANNISGTAAKATAANLTTTANAVAYYTDTAGTFGSKASANGALYATSANGALTFGTLPIAQGGTGKTTALAAITNLGGPYLLVAGTQITAETNLDTGYKAMGTYYSPDSTRSQTLAGTVPMTGSGFKMITAIGYRAATIRQFAGGASNDLYYRSSQDTGSTWTKWYKFVLLPSGSDNKTFAAIGGATQPVYVNSSGVITACTAYGSMATETATNYLKWQTTTEASTALYDFGVYVNMNNAAGTGPTGGNYFNIINIPYRKASGNTKPDWGFQIIHNTGNDSRLWYRTSNADSWGTIQQIAHADQDGNARGSAGQPVYMSATGVITAIDWQIGNSATGEHNCNNVTYNFCGYYTSNGPTAAANGAETSDASLWAQAYSASWVTQMAQDYRTGQPWVRSKNNGTWTTWKKVLCADEATTVLTDCNSVKMTGIWTKSNFSNKPANTTWGSLFNIRLYNSDNNYHRQLFFDCYGTDRIWTRSDNNSTWTAWTQLVRSVYSNALPTSGMIAGDVYFQLSDVQYELPAGGAANQVLTKNSAADRDVKWATLNAGTVTMTANNSTKYYVSGSTSTTTATLSPIFNTSVYVENSKLYGAAWNDYAEYRETEIEIEPGRVVIENGDDTLSLSTERMQPGAEIVTDTYGFAIGKTKAADTPIATTGRVLAYPAENRKSYKPGQPVCSGPNGTVSMMTDEEARAYPWLIIGTVSAIPDYDTWNDIKVNGRIWIRIR